jgi:hypothetical protein
VFRGKLMVMLRSVLDIFPSTGATMRNFPKDPSLRLGAIKRKKGQGAGQGQDGKMWSCAKVTK